jgi:hypothetical protein
MNTAAGATAAGATAAGATAWLAASALPWAAAVLMAGIGGAVVVWPVAVAVCIWS